MEAGDAESMHASVDQPARFAEVFDRHHSAVWRFVARTAGADAADDIGAEVFVVAFNRRSMFDPTRGTVRAWLLGIAYNLMRTRARAAWRGRRAVERAASIVDSSEFAIDDLLDAEDTHRRIRSVSAALALMSHDDREVLLLYAWDELSYQEIATVLAVPIGTVRSRLARARQRLQESVDADELATGSTP